MITSLLQFPIMVTWYQFRERRSQMAARFPLMRINSDFERSEFLRDDTIIIKWPRLATFRLYFFHLLLGWHPVYYNRRSFLQKQDQSRRGKIWNKWNRTLNSCVNSQIGSYRGMVSRYTHLVAYDIPFFLVVVLLQKLRFVRRQVHWCLKQRKSDFTLMLETNTERVACWLFISLLSFFHARHKI